MSFQLAEKVPTGTHGMPGLHTRTVAACWLCPECHHEEPIEDEDDDRSDEDFIEDLEADEDDRDDDDLEW